MNNKTPIKWDAVVSLMQTNHPDEGYDYIGKVVNIENLDGLSLIDGTTIAFDWDDVLSLHETLVAEFNTLLYARTREKEYNTINQLELLSDDAINDTTTYADAISAIKTKWPKNNTGPIE